MAEKVYNKNCSSADTAFKAENITERIVRITVPGNVCAFLAKGNERAALIDTGYGLGSIREYAETLTDLPMIVILTHGHYDHVGGASEFEHAFIPEQDFSLALAHSIPQTRVLGLAQNDIQTIAGNLTDALTPEQLLVYLPEEEFELGGLTVKMLPLPGHTKGCCCALFKEERILLLGDACNSFTFLQFEESLSVEEYRDSLIRFKNQYHDSYDTLIYSHPHNFGNKEIINEMICLCTDVTCPDFEPVSAAEMFGPGIYLAKLLDAGMRNLDGTQANLLYRKTL